MHSSNLNNTLNNSDSSSTSFDAAHRRAKVLEARLEQRVQFYSTMSTKIDNDTGSYFCQDVEGGMTSFSNTNEENNLSRDIDMDLNEMADCIDAMRSYASTNNTNEQHIIKRKLTLSLPLDFFFCSLL
jgi:hypothetical protein